VLTIFREEEMRGQGEIEAEVIRLKTVVTNKMIYKRYRTNNKTQTKKMMN